MVVFNIENDVGFFIGFITGESKDASIKENKIFRITISTIILAIIL